MKNLTLKALIVFGVGIANAGQINGVNGDFKVDGALTTGYFSSSNTGSSNHDSFKISNFVLGLNSNTKDGGIGFNVGFGTILLPTVYDGGLVNNKAIINKSFGPIYAILSYKPLTNILIDAGLLTTNIGYELATSYLNPNITFGVVWSAQPFIYPGARFTYTIGDIKFYAEVNKDKGYIDGNSSLSTNGAYSIGSVGTINGFNYTISYYDYISYKNIVDIVISKSINGNLDLGLNFDYQWLDDTAKVTGMDTKGYGIAGYIILKLDNLSLPIRLEYVNDGSKGKESGIYNSVSKAYTVTATATYKPTKFTYIRTEISYINSANKIFMDSSGIKSEDTKVSVAAELGFLF